MSADGEKRPSRVPGGPFATFLTGLPLLVQTHRDAFGAIILKLSAAFFSFLIIFIVARASGAAVTGDYAMAVATANMLSLLALLGLDQIVTRSIGGDLREGRPDLARAALFAAIKLVAPLAAVLAIIAFVAAPLGVAIDATPDAVRAIAVSVVAHPLLRMAVVTLRASGSVLLSQFFDGAHSLIILTAIGILILQGEVAIGSAMLSAIYSLALSVTMVCAWAMLSRRTRHWPKGAMNQSPLVSKSWPILLAGFCHVFTQWLILAVVGASMDSAQVGAFRVASQIVVIIALMLTTIESLVNPDLAGDFRTNDIAGAWRRHRQASIIMLLAAIVPIFLCLVFPVRILSLFGPEFVGAAGALMILVGAQIVNILTGPIGGIMVMSGHERLSLYLSLLGLVLSVALCLALIPAFGLLGAAVGAASSTIMRNIMAFVIMKRKLRVIEPAADHSV